MVIFQVDLPASPGPEFQAEVPHIMEKRDKTPWSCPVQIPDPRIRVHKKIVVLHCPIWVVYYAAVVARTYF